MLNICGVLEKSFTLDNNGKKREVHGYQVYCMDDSNSKVDGLSTTDFFMSDSLCERSSFIPCVGAFIQNIYYNRFGRIICVVPAAKSSK